MKEGKTIKNAFKNSQEGFGNGARMTRECNSERQRVFRIPR